MSTLWSYLPQLLSGLWLTLGLALSSLCLGLILGVLGAVGRLSSSAILRWLTTLITNLLRGIPELIIIFIVYYGMPPLLCLFTAGHIQISVFTAGAIALGLIFASYASEVFRGAIRMIDRRQIEAAYAFGFTPWKLFLRIILPQMLSNALPGLGNLWLVLLKDTALVALIGAADLMFVAQTVTATTKQAFLFYTAAASMYLILTSCSLWVLRHIEKRHYYHKHNIGSMG